MPLSKESDGPVEKRLFVVRPWHGAHRLLWFCCFFKKPNVPQHYFKVFLKRIVFKSVLIIRVIVDIFQKITDNF